MHETSPPEVSETPEKSKRPETLGGLGEKADRHFFYLLGAGALATVAVMGWTDHKLERVDERIDIVRDDVREATVQVGRLDERLAGLEGRVGRLDTRLKEGLAEVNEKVIEVDATVTRIESAVSTLGASVEKLAGKPAGANPVLPEPGTPDVLDKTEVEEVPLVADAGGSTEVYERSDDPNQSLGSFNGGLDESHRILSGGMTKGGGPMTVLWWVVKDLVDMKVMNARGEKIGEIGRVVRNGGDTYTIVEHAGGFLGLNDREIALPVNHMTLRANDTVWLGLTEEQIQALPKYDRAGEVPLDPDDLIKVTMIEPRISDAAQAGIIGD